MKPLLKLIYAILFLNCYSSDRVSLASEASSIYTVSFENAVHHEAHIEATFTHLPAGEVELTMSRSSPGRYALHEFVKNVYDLKVTDEKGNQIDVIKKDPYSWQIKEHSGTIKISYTLFANYGDGTYAQIDETHAHLNMPATFMYIKELQHDPFQVTYNVPEDLNWKVATQLKHIEDNTYYAQDLQYFLDSPTEISDYSLRSFQLDEQTINFVLHHNGTEAEFDAYFESVKKIVIAQKNVFDELPTFDYGNYYFLACYLPQVSGDAMEHRNSTYLTTTRSLAEGGLRRNLGSVSHEFFHVWNVERLRPQSLEPFDFSEANMSGELWFSEGFTNYYDNLTEHRAGLTTTREYINSLNGVFNYVWNSPGRKFYSPIEMSYQAPFVDRAVSADPNNRSNTFISYYSYGDMLGLALDLALRKLNLTLDDYMKLLWNKYGKTETYFTISDLENTLSEYTGSEFSSHFFKNYIYKSGMPDMERLFENVGVALIKNENKAWFGNEPIDGELKRNTIIDSPAYNAGLEKGDVLISIGNFQLGSRHNFSDLLSNFKPMDSAKVIYQRYGKLNETIVRFTQDPRYTIMLFEDVGKELNKKQQQARANWLHH